MINFGWVTTDGNGNGGMYFPCSYQYTRYAFACPTTAGNFDDTGHFPQIVNLSNTYFGLSTSVPKSHGYSILAIGY